MAILKTLSAFFILTLTTTPVWAQNSAELFTQGTQAYLSKDYKKAAEAFQKSLDLDPNNTTVLTNMALTEFQLGDIPKSLGLLRKALNFDPTSATARESLNFILSERPVRQTPRSIGIYENVRNEMLEPVSLSAYLGFFALLLLSSGWTLISYVGRRKKAWESESSAPPLPLIPGILIFLSFIFLGLVLLKLYDSRILRGTILFENTALQTAPGENQVSIMALPAGIEVEVKNKSEDWIQITFPGSATGWIKKSAILMTR